MSKSGLQIDRQVFVENLIKNGWKKTEWKKTIPENSFFLLNGSWHTKFGEGLETYASFDDSYGFKIVQEILRRQIHGNKEPLGAEDVWGIENPTDARMLKSKRATLLEEGDFKATKKTVRQIRERIKDIDERLKEDPQNDQLTEDREVLQKYLKDATGLGGKLKKLMDEEKKVRDIVGKRLRDTYKKIEAKSPKLAKHLRASIQTRNGVIYQPEEKILWNLEPPKDIRFLRK